MPATGEPQSLAPELDPLNMAKLLLRRVAGEPFPYSFIHEVSAYSAAPEILVRGRDGDTRGKEMAWYFCSAINVHRSGGTRNRQVGGGGHTLWHPEGGRKQIQGLRGSDGESVVAYSRKLSYGRKINNPPGAAAAKSFTIRRLGWCMVEVFLEQHAGAAGQRLELCKVYRSPSARSTADPAETTTATAGAVDIRPAASNGVSRVEVRQHDSALEGGAIPEVIGGDMACPPAPAPPPASCDYNVHSPGVARSPALLIGSAASIQIHGSLTIFNKSNAASVPATVVMKLDGSSIPSAERMKEMARLVLSFDNPVVILSAMGNTASNILLAAWKALSCDPREASKINEFKYIRELHLRTIADLGLESSIVSGLLDELEHHLQYVATTKDMTSTTRDYLVSIVEATSTKMFFGSGNCILSLAAMAATWLQLSLPETWD